MLNSDNLYTSYVFDIGTQVVIEHNSKTTLVRTTSTILVTDIILIFIQTQQMEATILTVGQLVNAVHQQKMPDLI